MDYSDGDPDFEQPFYILKHTLCPAVLTENLFMGIAVQDPRPHQLKMLERAVKDAREKAQIMATALGCMLAEVREINYSHEDIHIYSQARNIHSADEAKVSTVESLDITPEDLAISDDVTVEWVLVSRPSN